MTVKNYHKIKNIRFPKSIKLFGKRIDVQYKPQDIIVGESLYNGYCFNAYDVVQLRSDLGVNYVMDTLIHELIHYILGTTGHVEANSNEPLIHVLAAGFLDLMVSNPDLIKAFMQLHKENNPNVQ